MSIPISPENMPRSVSACWVFIGRLVLRILGWQVEGDLPNYKKAILIVAPHTSNWDFVIGMAAKMALGVKANWLGKGAIFVGPAALMFKSWGGIPVARDDAHNLVSNVVSEFQKREKMWLGLSPEGTRTHVEEWKSGFWHIAKAAELPIQTVVFDYSRRMLVIGEVFMPTDDKATDVAAIRAYFAEVGNGKIPSGE
jgi:1-acyl-sn-glycerol-3-phosphate acyltransferase